MYYDHSALIDSRDVDGCGHCRPSALLGHMQECATLAAETGGFGRERLLREYNAFWMVVRMWFSLKRPLLWQERVRIRTWHRGGRTAQCYRDFELYVAGEQVGEAVSLWVLAGREKRKLLRLSSVPFLAGTDGGALCKEKSLARLRLPPDMEEEEHRRMRYSDSDINAHVNHTRYADFACDALCPALPPKDIFLREMQLDYNGECRPGEELVILTGGEGERRYVCGADYLGKTRFSSLLIFGTVAA